MSIEIGRPAPDFELPATNGGTVSLSDYRGKRVILYFYPQDMTPTCTTQACEFRDNAKRFTARNAVILGISRDPVARHRKFIDKYGLPFLLLADEDHRVADLYGVWRLKKLYGREYMGIERSTFLIDENGILRKAWGKVRIKGHIEAVLDALS